jgi:hypothetical protein
VEADLKRVRVECARQFGGVWLGYELQLSEQGYESMALADLLGVPADKVNDDRLYRALDRILPTMSLVLMFHFLKQVSVRSWVAPPAVLRCVLPHPSPPSRPPPAAVAHGWCGSFPPTPSRRAVSFVSSDNSAADTHVEHTNMEKNYKRIGLHYTQIRAVTGNHAD